MESCVIEQLIAKPFGSKSHSEKLNIVLTGRPCPEIPLQTTHKDKSQIYVRHFHTSQYSKIPWLTGSAKSRKLFCWPCLLFSKERNVWNNEGYDNMSNYTNAVKKHDQSQNHISALLQMKFFGKSVIDDQLDEQLRVNEESHNESVKKNREILKRLIDMICFVTTQELPFSKRATGEDPVVEGNYPEALNLLATYDSTLSAHLEASPDFRGSLNKIQTRLVDSLAEMITERIKEELEEASFAVLILGQSSPCRSWTVLRYFRPGTGQVYERFLSFTDSSRGGDSVEQVARVVAHFRLQEKLVALSCDGTVLLPDENGGLKAKLGKLFPKALFVHSFNHSLNFILSQAVSRNKECRVFFKILSGLGTFFSKSSNRTHLLNECVDKSILENSARSWNFSSGLVQTIKKHKASFEEFFRKVVEDCDNRDSETVILAGGFLTFLSDPQTAFLLDVFCEIFTRTEVLAAELREKHLDVKECAERVRQTIASIESERKELREEGIPSPPPEKRHRGSGNKNENLREEIFDAVVAELRERFASLSSLEYTSLLDPSKFEAYKKNFPNWALENLEERFDVGRLKNELTVLYSFEGLSGLHPRDLMQCLRKRELGGVLPEVWRLGQLLLVLPSTIASWSWSFSARQRIEAFEDATRGRPRIDTFPLLAIEKNLLKQLRNTATFYDDAIKHFTAKEKSSDFTFK